jgi:predicted PolB exonuclease-like 3'-5' exonuclease
MDALSEFGASKAAGLHELCALLGIPAKVGMDGSEVESYFQQGRINEIRMYCQRDVLATYLVFLKFAHFRGELNDVGYDRSVESVQKYLAVVAQDRPHLKPFIK